MVERQMTATESPSPPARVHAEKTQSDLGALLRLLLTQKGLLAFAAALSVVSALTTLAQPLVITQAIDSVTNGRGLAPSIWLLAGLLAAAAILTGVQQYLLQRIGEGVVLMTRTRLIRRVFRLRMPEYDRRSIGDFVSRVSSDTTSLRLALIQAAVTSVGGMITIVGAAIAMAVIDLPLLGLTVAIIAVSLIAVLGLGSLVRGASLRAQQALGDLSGSLERGLRGIRTIRAANATEAEEQRVEKHAIASWRAGVTAARLIAIISPVSGLCTQIALLTVLGVGGYRVTTGEMSIADLVAFMLFLVMLVMPLSQAFGAVGTVNQALGAFARIREIQSLPTEERTEHETGRVDPSATDAPAISFREVCFRYEGVTAETAGATLDRISFDVPLGKRVAIVGPSGGGKSTILQLIERFYEADSGSIRVFGSDMDTLERASLRATIGYVEQDAPALGGTIRENLTLGLPWVTETECLQVLDTVNLNQLLSRSPRGLDHPVGDGGVTLSGGERQRLGIARALLNAPPLLLLDESTSSLDGRNEVHMREAIDAVAAGRSVIVVAHRLSTVIDADEIIVVDHGRIVGRGTHAELLEGSSLYRQLAESQLLA